MVSNQQLGSLSVLLWKEGWCLPDLGGIDHQTVGGFLSTGSAGGSSIDKGHDISGAIMAIRIIDGTGKEHFLKRSDDIEDPFFAVGVSMGLFGVITEVTFRCVPTFCVSGEQVTASIFDANALQVDFFGTRAEYGPGIKNVAEFLKQQDYGRILWWPQPGLQKATVWRGNRSKARGDFQSVEYVEVGSTVSVSNGRMGLQHAGAFILKIGNLIPWIKDLAIGYGFPESIINTGGCLLYKIYSQVLAALFVPNETCNFQDYSFKAIPMDNCMDDDVIHTEFTELWIDINDIHRVIEILRDEYEQQGFEAAGNYCLEIYGSRKSDFWLSPSFGKDVVRFNWFWFGHNMGHPVDTGFFPRFWKLLQEFKYRPHWGKWLPEPGSYLPYDKLYPKMKAWKQLRQQFDPDDIFLTDYWSFHLNIHPQDRSLSVPRPRETFDTRTLFERMSAANDCSIQEVLGCVKHPHSLEDLEDLMSLLLHPDKTKENSTTKRIKAVGTRYSYGNVAYVDPKESMLIDTSSHLNRIALGDNIPVKLKKSVDIENLCYAEAGATLEMINNFLWPRFYRQKGYSKDPSTQRPFKTMKAFLGYQQLSAVGTILSGAHGTGAKTPPLADFVRSILVLTYEGDQIVRKTIEPSKGITDPDLLTSQERENLIQDDKVFYSCIVSMGAIGVVYSIVFEVEDAYYVETECVSFKLRHDSETLAKAIDDSILEYNLGLILFQNPFRDREGVMRVFKRHKGPVMPQDLQYQTVVPFKFSHSFIQFLTDLIVSSARSENAKKLIPEFFTLFTQLLQWPCKGRKTLMDAPTAFDLGTPSAMKVNVSEVAYGFSNGVEAVAALQDVCDVIEAKTPKDNKGTQGSGWLTAPLIVELVGESKAYMAESFGREHVITMEMPGFWEYEKTDLLQQSVMTDMWNRGYTVHWGENIFNLVDQSLLPGQRHMQLNYPGFKKWQRVVRQYTKSSKERFVNKFVASLLKYPERNEKGKAQMFQDYSLCN